MKIENIILQHFWISIFFFPMLPRVSGAVVKRSFLCDFEMLIFTIVCSEKFFFFFPCAVLYVIFRLPMCDSKILSNFHKNMYKSRIYYHYICPTLFISISQQCCTMFIYVMWYDLTIYTFVVIRLCLLKSVYVKLYCSWVSVRFGQIRLH